MTYTGVVEQGGPPDVREVPGLLITKVCTPPFTNNCYLLRCTATGDTLLVDAAGDAPRLLVHAGDAADLPVPATRLVADGDTIQVGEVTLSVVHLLGHTPGSVALVYRGDPERPHVFSGDSLFPGGVGNTEKDPARFGTLIDDVERKLFGRLPDETWVYPGHGTDTTLGAERPALAGWRERGW